MIGFKDRRLYISICIAIYLYPYYLYLYRLNSLFADFLKIRAVEQLLFGAKGPRPGHLNLPQSYKYYERRLVLDLRPFKDPCRLRVYHLKYGFVAGAFNALHEE